MKTVKGGTEDRPESLPPGEYFVVVAEYSTFFVDADVAARIGRMLDRRWLPRWVKFADLNGARVWLRARSIGSIHESTEWMRSRDRAFHYARRREEASDRRWDDDEFC
jgi:hypothetical protein